MSWPGMTYTDPGAALALAADDTAPPWHCPTGNGRRVPTRYRVKYPAADGRARWHRVYVMRYDGRDGPPFLLLEAVAIALHPATLAALREEHPDE